MKKGNCLRIFYNDGARYTAIALSTSDSLNYSNEVTQISSKDHGKYPTVEQSSASWSFSGQCLFDATQASTIMAMAKAGTPYSFCFAQIQEDATWADGLKSLTGNNTQTRWNVGSAFVQYGQGIITSVSMEASDGEQATMSLEITGSGQLTDTAPATPASFSSSANSSSASSNSTSNSGSVQMNNTVTINGQSYNVSGGSVSVTGPVTSMGFTGSNIIAVFVGTDECEVNEAGTAATWTSALGGGSISTGTKQITYLPTANGNEVNWFTLTVNGDNIGGMD